MSKIEPAYPTPLEGQLLTDLTEELRGAVGFEIPEAEVKRLYEGREQLLGEAREWGVHDTVIRGEIQRILARDLVDRDWPTFGDGPEAGERFDAELAAAAKARGWTPYTYMS